MTEGDRIGEYYICVVCVSVNVSYTYIKLRESHVLYDQEYFQDPLYETNYLIFFIVHYTNTAVCKNIEFKNPIIKKTMIKKLMITKQ